MKNLIPRILVLVTFAFITSFSFAQAPTITSFTPSSGSVGSTVTISGTNFNSTLSNNIVFFGATQATVTSGSATSLTVTVPSGASFGPISVTDVSTGLTCYSSQFFNPTFPCGANIDTNTFSTKIDLSAENRPAITKVNDIDGDEKADLIVLNNTQIGSISIFRNTSSNGSLSFASKINFSTDSISGGISIGDINGDGKADLVVTNFFTNSFSVFRNMSSNGSISFAPRIDFSTDQYASNSSIADLDGDGKLDLAIEYGLTKNLSIYRNTSSNTSISFGPKIDFARGGLPGALTTGDFDGDNKADLVLRSTSQNNDTISIFLNTSTVGTISFAPKVYYTTNFNSGELYKADLDGDNKLDLINHHINLNIVSVFRNTSSGGTISFAPKEDFTTAKRPVLISIADLDGDDKLDLVTANTDPNFTKDTLSIFRNTSDIGTVSFAPRVDLSRDNYPSGLSISDLDGDSKPSIIVSNLRDSSISIYRNTLDTIIVNANASATTVCSGTSVTLTGSGGADAYVWTGGVTDGVGFVPPVGTSTYEVTPAVGCNKTDSITITVNPLPTVTATSTATSICEGDSVTLSASGNADTYSWSGGVTDGQPFVPATGTNTYTVTGTITATGCQDTAQVNVRTNPLPTMTITKTDITKCSGPCNGTATANPVGGNVPYSFLWSNNETTPTATSLCQGKFDVVVSDFNGCSVTNNDAMKVRTVANPNIYLTNLAAIDQVNVSSAFSSFYTFNLPASINTNSTNPRNLVDPGKKARFKVECTNQKSNGQSIVSGICKVRTNNPYITITDSSSALNNIGWNGDAWSADEFEIDIDANTPPGTNAYIDFVVQENGQNYSTTCISIPITPLVYSTTTPSTIDDDNNPDSQGNDNDYCEPNEIIEFYPWLDNVSTLNAEYVRGQFENLNNLSYINIWDSVPGVNTTVYDAGWWNFGFGQPQVINSSSINTTPEYDFVFEYNNATLGGKFDLHMVMAGGFKLFSGNALSLVQWSLPFSFNDTIASSIGSELELENNFHLYPNPANNSIKIINNNYKEDLPYYITNSLGKNVIEGILSQNLNAIDISHLASGIYFVKIGSSNLPSFKLIKK